MLNKVFKFQRRIYVSLGLNELKTPYGLPRPATMSLPMNYCFWGMLIVLLSYRETPWVRWCAEGDQLGGSSGQRLRPQAVAVTAWSTQLISRSVPQHEGGFPFIPYFKTFKNCTTNNNKRCFIGTKINYVIHLLHYVIHHERSRSSVSRALLRDTGISTG